MEQADEEDREKLRAIFAYYNLFTAAPSLIKTQPLTPKEIGYLSPRVPRPLKTRVIAPEQDQEVEPVAVTEQPLPKPELHETLELMLEDETSVFVRSRSLEIPHVDRPIHLAPGCRFQMGTEKVAFAGTVEDPSRPDLNGRIVVRINADDPDSGLHRILTEAEVSERGSDFWPFTNENLSFERLKESYERQVEVLKATGVLDNLPYSRVLGVVGVDDKDYVLPSFDKVVERILRNQEMINAKAEQGFTELLLVPLATPLGSKTDVHGQIEYTGLLGAYAEELRHEAIHQGGTLLAEKRNPTDPDEPLTFDKSEPLYVWNKLQGSDLPGAAEPMLYYPEKFDASGQGGKTKSELLAVDPGAGWEILLTQNLAVIPGEGQGKAEGDRPPMESMGRNPHIPMAVGQNTPSIQEYLGALANPEATSPYQNESGLTLEAWLTMAIQKLHATGQVLDDYQGQGKISYLLGNFVAGYVPSADFNRGNRQSDLDGDDPEFRYGCCGVRSAVRVP